MSNQLTRSGAAHKDSIVRRSLAIAMVIALPTLATVQANEASEAFFVLDNPGDRNFNQLLGINDAQLIVGYFGDGATIANNGYVLVPQNHYAVENFTHLPPGDSASQTQAIGISNDSFRNSESFPKIVGFYTDNATGFTHGFLDAGGVQATIDDPAGLTPHVAAPAQNLLGVNQFNDAAGFWTDGAGHVHGFVVEINAKSPGASKFMEISPSTFHGAVATQASDITDSRKVCGLWTDAKGNNHGFFGRLGKLSSFDVTINGVKATSTSPFGCNNEDNIVGSFTDAGGNVHGFVLADHRFKQFDAPGSSQAPAFGVSGTLINGVNDQGDIVGFFSDGTKVHGFVKFADDERE